MRAGFVAQAFRCATGILHEMWQSGMILAADELVCHSVTPHQPIATRLPASHHFQVPDLLAPPRSVRPAFQRIFFGLIWDCILQTSTGTGTGTGSSAGVVPEIDVCGHAVGGVSCPGAGKNGYFYRCCSSVGHCGMLKTRCPQKDADFKFRQAPRILYARRLQMVPLFLGISAE